MEIGFTAIKLNSVLMRHTNDHEAINLVNFAIRKKIDISYMKV